MHIDDVLPRDAIPSIDEPVFGMEYVGDPEDEVIVVEGDPSRAYPVRILSYHEIVNDVLESRGPIAVTWCPICASGIVFDRTVDERVLSFGTSGKLADDALVMYDRETGSEWKQPLGRAIAGPLDGSELDVLPAAIMTWERFRTAHPDGLVLQPDRPGSYDMERYEAYNESAEFGLYGMRGSGRQRTWDREDIGPKTPVLGIVVEDTAVGYPIPTIHAAGGTLVDTIGSLDVLVVATDEVVGAFKHPGGDIELRGGELVGEEGRWDPVTGAASSGKALHRLPTRRLYAFAWQDDHGADSFYGLGSGQSEAT
ncbi:MAG: DUF3179 domain-containing protein [Salinirussus sp.]